MTLFELLGLLRKHLVLVILLPLATAGVVAVGSIFLPNEYTATTTMYVLSKTDDQQVPLTQSDLSAGQMLTNDVATILRSDRVRHDVAQQFGPVWPREPRRLQPFRHQLHHHARHHAVGDGQ